jgi:hypothetical protein
MLSATTKRVLLVRPYHHCEAPNGLLSGRLSRLKRPKIAPAPKQQRFGGLRQKPATTKAKGKGKGRNHGKLTQLMEMPLDVLFEARLPTLTALTSIVDTYFIRSLPSWNLSIFCSFHGFLSASARSLHPKAPGIFGLPLGKIYLACLIALLISASLNMHR